MKNVNMLLNNKLPTDLYTTFHIIKLLIRKGNLNLIYNKITYQHYIYQSSSIQALPTYKYLYIHKKLPTHKWRPNIA